MRDFSAPASKVLGGLQATTPSATEALVFVDLNVLFVLFGVCYWFLRQCLMYHRLALNLLRMTLNFGASSLHLPIAGIAGVVPTTRGFMQCRAWNPGPPACQARIPLLT